MLTHQLITTPMGTEPKAMYDEYGMPVLAGVDDGQPVRFTARESVKVGFWGAFGAVAGIAVGTYVVAQVIDIWPYGKKR